MMGGVARVSNERATRKKRKEGARFCNFRGPKEKKKKEREFTKNSDCPIQNCPLRPRRDKSKQGAEKLPTPPEKVALKDQKASGIGRSHH